MRIELRNVGKRFGRVTALRDVTLTIPTGARVALIGPNGSGKSTLTRALMGLVKCTGKVRIDGRSPFADRVELARRLAYVPQVAPQIKAPVGELLRAVVDVRGIDPSSVRRVAGELGLDLLELERRPFRNLSGGMKLKVLIALALGSDASLLIMDEPTSSLDATARERFFSLFEGLARDTTLILCSHRLEEIRHLVNHVVALHEGTVAYHGPAAEYLARSAFSVVEVHVENGAYSAWLEDHGFVARAGGWWASTVAHSEKMALLSAMSETLGQGVSNLLVRDLETVQAEAASPANGSGEGGNHG